MTSKKPALLMINGSQFGYSAGHYYYCLYLREYFDIHYLCYDRGLKKTTLEGIQINYVEFNSNKLKRIFSFLRAAVSQSRAIQPNVLFVVYFNLCFLLPLFCKSKISVLDIRTGSLAESAGARNRDNFLIKAQSVFFKNKIILSESLRLKLSISSKHTLVLPLGSEIYFSGEHRYEQLHLLYVGVFDGRNLSDTINGLALYLSKYPGRRAETIYTIIGFGSKEEEHRLTVLTKDLQLEDVIKFEGRKTYAEFAPYFKEANIGVSYVPVTEYYHLQPPTKTFEYILSGLFTIATATFENKKLISQANGVICEDSAAAFALSIEQCFNLRPNLRSDIIRQSLAEYEWIKLVKNKLLPFLKEI